MKEFEYRCENCVHDGSLPCTPPCEDCEQVRDDRPSYWTPASSAVTTAMIQHIKAEEAANHIADMVFGRAEYDDPDHPEPDVKEDVVNHPSHYCRDGAMECFEEFRMIYGDVAAFYACLFNLHKYRYRAGDKNGKEDIQKSDRYVQMLKELKEATGIELELKATTREDMMHGA